MREVLLPLGCATLAPASLCVAWLLVVLHQLLAVIQLLQGSTYN